MSWEFYWMCVEEGLDGFGKFAAKFALGIVAFPFFLIGLFKGRKK